MHIMGLQESDVSMREELQKAMPQRDDTIEAIRRLNALLEYAVMHDDEAEADRLRVALRRLTEKI